MLSIIEINDLHPQWQYFRVVITQNILRNTQLLTGKHKHFISLRHCVHIFFLTITCPLRKRYSNNDITLPRASQPLCSCEKSNLLHHHKIKSRLTDTRREQTKLKSRSDAHTRTKTGLLALSDVSYETVIVLYYTWPFFPNTQKKKLMIYRFNYWMKSVPIHKFFTCHQNNGIFNCLVSYIIIIVSTKEK